MDKDYNNVLSYTESQMLTLCNSQAHKIAERTHYSFIRPTNSIYVDFTYEQCLQANYIAFQNTDYSSKWFFAWIDEVIYKGDKNCEIKYTVDSWSTWFDKWTKKPCFVVREHTNDDTIGINTIPENLDVGEITNTFEIQETGIDTSQSFFVILESNYLPLLDSTEESTIKGVQFDGISVYNKGIMGNKLIFFKINSNSFANDIKNISRYISRTNKDGHIGDVKNMYIAPSGAINETDLTTVTAYIKENNQDVLFTYKTTNENNLNTSPVSITRTINKVTSFPNVNIKNNKCFCYPYNYFTVTNNSGSLNIYKYEDFSSSNCEFGIIMSIVCGVSGRCAPHNYKGLPINFDESIPLGKFPTCSWSSDAYTNWLTEQAVNLPTRIVNTGINTLTSVSGIKKLGDVAGSASSIANDVADLIGGFYKAQLMPNIEGGQNTADVMWSSNNNGIVYKGFRAKDEYIKIIDDYFSRFGYKINRVKEPNIVGRTYWNYVEIGGSEEIGNGDCPAPFMQSINNACRKGVTIWHDHANIGNFSLDNTIVNP